MLLSFFRSPSIDWFLDDDRYIDVSSFAAQERLKVHEARTAADLGSSVLRASEIEKRERDRRLRTRRRKVAA